MFLKQKANKHIEEPDARHHQRLKEEEAMDIES